MMVQPSRSGLAVVLLAASAAVAAAFAPSKYSPTAPRTERTPFGISPAPHAPQTQTTTSLTMVFDFFRDRATEGLQQTQQLLKKTGQGKLGEGLVDAAAYTKSTNDAFATGLAKSRNKLLYGLEAALTGQGDLLEELEDVLLQADLGLSTAEDVLTEVKSLREDSTKIFSRDDIRSILRGKLIEALEVEGDRRIRFEGMDLALTELDGEGGEAEGEKGEGEEGEKKEKSGLPTVLFVMGANGMGKTTTIGKLSSRLRTEGSQKVLVAACDTFRAGAVEQLEQWAARAEVDCYSPNDTANTPAAVLYGSIDECVRGGYDTLIVDTSGRLSNNDALTAELAKMKRVIQKRLSVEDTYDDKGKAVPVPNMNVPHETLLVIDAAQGRMALDSARQWNKEIGLTGLVLTKLDGSARGGSVVAVSRELGLPVKLIGVGEGIDDLRDFDPESFVDGLLGIGNAGGNSGSGASDEGRALAGRLTEMRKARDERAEVRKKEEKVVAKAAKTATATATTAGPGSGPAGEMEFQEMDEPTGDASGSPQGGTPKKPKNKKKKKKKKKGKR